MPVKNTMFALIGNFGFQARLKGIGVYRYDPESARMEWIETAFDNVNVGYQAVDMERGIVYITDETSNLRGQLGGGGYLLAVKVDPLTGKLVLMNEKPTLSTKPCFICLDKTRRYALVSHHGDSGCVTKIVKDQAGYSSVSVFDDTALILFSVNEDGSLGEVMDVALTPGDGASGSPAVSHLHAVIADPTGELFIVMDKGLDTFHTFHLDRENAKLVQLQDTHVETGMQPRYGVFHPFLPVFYANFEQTPVVHAYHYDVPTGKLELIDIALLVKEGASKVAAADILIHPNGKTVYASVRGTNTISMLDIDETGLISHRGSVSCGGVNPRSLSISPDERFLFSANVESGSVVTFSIEADGSLHPCGVEVRERCPGGIRFIAV